MMLFFDVGETLASEERWLGSWADWLGVPRPVFFAALGALIEARRPHTELFPLFRSGIDVAAERNKRGARGISDRFTAVDLYPDALSTLQWARTAGHRLGISGNNSAPHRGVRPRSRPGGRGGIRAALGRRQARPCLLPAADRRGWLPA